MSALSAPSQLRRAGDRSNEVRAHRRQLKAQLRARQVRIEDVIAEPDWWLSSLYVFELLGWAPRVGIRRVNTWLRRADVWPLREVGQLTMAQRERLLREMRRP